MNDAQFCSLRRTVRRDEKISNGAARLFAEVVGLHLMEDGCFAQDTTLARWLNTTARTIRRWRKELYQAGYLKEEPGDQGRHLIPHEAEPDKNVQDDRTKSSGQNCPDRTELSGGPDKNDRTKMSEPDKSVQDRPDNFVQHREYNIPQAGGPESERAHAHDPRGADGTSTSGGSAGGKPRIDSLDSITEEVLNTRLRGLTQKDKIRQVCEKHGQAGWDVLREVCYEIEENDWSVNGSVIYERLTTQLQMLQSDDSTATADDSFRERSQSIREAARRGAGVD
jgi:hypothetical protein